MSLFFIRHEAPILGAGPLGQFGESSCRYAAVFVLYGGGLSNVTVDETSEAFKFTCDKRHCTGLEEPASDQVLT